MWQICQYTLTISTRQSQGAGDLNELQLDGVYLYMSIVYAFVLITAMQEFLY